MVKPAEQRWVCSVGLTNIYKENLVVRIVWSDDCDSCGSYKCIVHLCFCSACGDLGWVGHISDDMVDTFSAYGIRIKSVDVPT